MEPKKNPSKCLGPCGPIIVIQQINFESLDYNPSDYPHVRYADI